MNKSSKIITIASIVAVACIGLFVLESHTKVLHRTIDNFVYDNKNHYLPCDKLPTEAGVNQVVQEHQDIVEAIEKVNLASVYIDTITCPGKADLLIVYGSHADRIQIEKIIDGDLFFGIPYRLNNQ